MHRHSHAAKNALLSAVLLAATPASFADRPAAHAHTEAGQFPREMAAYPTDYADSKPPLWNNLGTLSSRITTDSSLAQQYFDQGLRLAYAFNHLEAQRAFRMAQKLDPKCAMCFWGEALVLGPNINAPMEFAAVAPAWAAITRAQALAKHGDAREKGLIKALAKRYAKDPQADRRKLDEAYAGVMGRLHARFPEDEQIAVLYAESLMDLSPWNYWEDGGKKPKGRTGEIVKTLERVLARNPDHPGAIHYYIHIVESSDRPERAEAYADRLGAMMPGAGHLVHMPGHLYYRLGRYVDALKANRAAIAADEAYLQETGAQGIYAQGYYPHNVHFLMVAAQMAGDAETALSAADKLAKVIRDETVRSVAWMQPVKAAPYFAHAQFGSPESVAKIPDPGAEFPYVQAMWRYARGVSFAQNGSVPEARSELETLIHIEKTADFSKLTAAGIPALEVLRIAEQVLIARIAQVQGEPSNAIAGFEKAALLQEKLPYMEPPYWYYPVRRSLGAMRFLAGEFENAERELNTSLRRAPNDAWALQALVEVYRKRGNPKAAEEASQSLAKAQAGSSAPVAMNRL